MFVFCFTNVSKAGVKHNRNTANTEQLANKIKTRTSFFQHCRSRNAACDFVGPTRIYGEKEVLMEGKRTNSHSYTHLNTFRQVIPKTFVMMDVSDRPPER